jgi:glycyl-tRNA synthetase
MEKASKKDLKQREKLEEINKIAGKRGIFFQTAGIYGGKAGFFTYGHLGKKIKLNWENLWRKHILSLDDNFHEIQSNNILPEPVFQASGHIKNFNDPLTECKKCHFRFRADQFLEDNGVEEAEKLSEKEMTNLIQEKTLRCPKCGSELSEVRQFNMMFLVPIGLNNEKGYLSPETAQAAYLAFKDEFEATRKKLPLGLAIIDKAYRNEISPRQMFFRLREFTQAELQIFFNPDNIKKHEKWEQVAKRKLIIKLSDKKQAKEISCEKANKELNLPKFYVYYAAKIQEFYLDVLKIPKDKFRFRELSKEERAFYNKIHFDIEIMLETLGGFKEVAGLHYRTDHDLKGHGKVSGKNMQVFDEQSKKKVLPHVLELSFGVDRNIWSLLDIFYTKGKEGSMFEFPPDISPIQVAIFPIVKKDEKLVKIAQQVHEDLSKDFEVIYDGGGSVGRRYARQDEIGTPFCITIDGESIKGKDVTIRDRDTTKQIRVKINKLREILRKLISGEIDFGKVGKTIKDN